MTARPNQIRSASSAIAVELAMDAELAERVRTMLIEWPDIEVVDAEHGRIPRSGSPIARWRSRGTCRCSY